MHIRSAADATSGLSSLGRYSPGCGAAQDRNSAARPPVKGEWPWDEVGTLDAGGRVVTPADVVLNRLFLVFRVIDWGTGSAGLGVRREL